MPLRTYRQTVAPEVIDTSFVDTGASRTAQELGNLLTNFRNKAAAIGVERATRMGTAAGAEAGASGNPQFKEGLWSYTAYGEAYNNSATRSYAIKAEADAEDTAARLEVEAANDPQKFQATFSAVRDSTLKVAPVQVRGILADMYNKRLAEGTARLSQAQAVEMHKSARGDLSEGLSRIQDRVAQLRAADDPALAAQADQEELRMGQLIDAATSDGTISAVEARALHKDATDSITFNTVAARFDKELGNPYGDPVKFLKSLHEANKGSEALSPEQETKLENLLYARLERHNALERAGDALAQQTQEAKWEAGDQASMEEFLQGKLSMQTILGRVQNGDLKPSTSRVYVDMLRGGGSTDDAHGRLVVETSLDQFTEQQILARRDLTDDTKRELILKKRQLESEVLGSPQAAEGGRILRRAIGIQDGVPNPIVSQQQLRSLADAQNEYYSELQALPPEQRSSQAIQLAKSVSNRFLASATQKRLDAAQRSMEALQQRAAGDDKADAADAKAAIPALDTRIRQLQAQLAQQERQ